MEEHVLHQILVTVLKDIQEANVKQVRFRLLCNEYTHTLCNYIEIYVKNAKIGLVVKC